CTGSAKGGRDRARQYLSIMSARRRLVGDLAGFPREDDRRALRAIARSLLRPLGSFRIVVRYAGQVAQAGRSPINDSRFRLATADLINFRSAGPGLVIDTASQRFRQA